VLHWLNLRYTENSKQSKSQQRYIICRDRVEGISGSFALRKLLIEDNRGEDTRGRVAICRCKFKIDWKILMN
jgi:hypothetical protein